MKSDRILQIMLLGLLVVPAFAFSATSESGNISFTVTETATTQEKVMTIDYQTRKVALQDEKGNVRALTVGQSVSNLNRVRVGDEVTIVTHTDISVEVQRGPGETMNIGSESQTSALPGAKPSGTRTIEGKLKTRVEAIDYEARTITFKGRDGAMKTYKISPDVKQFSDLRRGDMLVAEYAQTLTLSVK